MRKPLRSGRLAGLFSLWILLCLWPKTSDAADVFGNLTLVSSNSSVNGLVAGNGRLIAWGDLNRILISKDGVNWVTNQLGLTSRVTSAGFGNSRIWLGCRACNLLSSPDGEQWSQQVLSGPVEAFISALLIQEHKYVAAIFGDGRVPHEEGSFRVSTNGTDWIRVEAGTNAPRPIAIAFGNGIIASPGQGTVVLTSTNGFDWHEPGVEEAHDALAFRDLAFGNGLFVGPAPVFSWLPASADAANWTGQVDPAFSTIQNVAFTGGIFIATGFTNLIFTSTDGTNWLRHVTTVSNQFGKAIYFNGRFVLLLKSPVRAGIMVTDDVRPTVVTEEVRRSTNGVVSFVVKAPFPGDLFLESSGDLVNWLPLTNTYTAGGLSAFTDKSSPDGSRRFYRVRTELDWGNMGTLGSP